MPRPSKDIIVELTAAFRSSLRSARFIKQMTQAETAQRIGVSEAFYSRLERGLALPKVITLVRIMEALDVSADSLFGRPSGWSLQLRARHRRAARAAVRQ